MFEDPRVKERERDDEHRIHIIIIIIILDVWRMLVHMYTHTHICTELSGVCRRHTEKNKPRTLNWHHYHDDTHVM